MDTRSALNLLSANVALLDHSGTIIAVNDQWRRFGAERGASSDYVGLNYVAACGVAKGDPKAVRVAEGLQRLLSGKSDSFGLAYECADKVFRLTARRVTEGGGGALVAHQDITMLVMARRDRSAARADLQNVRQSNADRIDHAAEEVNQRLTAISLAASAFEGGGNADDAVTLIRFAVEEGRQQLKQLRIDARRENDSRDG